MNKILGWTGIVIGSLAILGSLLEPDGWGFAGGIIYLLMGIALVRNETTK